MSRRERLPHGGLGLVLQHKPDTSRDLPGLVHGIVSLDPPRVRCDGCGFEATGFSLTLVVLTGGVQFSDRRFSRGDERRLCRECRRVEWPEDTF